jgi:hypothetical protein
MGTITDYEDWLKQADPIDHEEVYALYMAVEHAESFGIFNCTPSADNSQWLVRSGIVDDVLLLVSAQARNEFLSLIHERYCDPELDMHEWYHFMRSIG